jgi:PAS domain S-box-containing protein
MDELRKKQDNTTDSARLLAEARQAEEQLRSFAWELEQRNETLRKSEERYHKMIAEIEDYAIILLDTNGNIQNWTTGAEKIKGYKAEEIIGKNFRIFYLPQDRDNKLPEKLLERVIREGKSAYEGWRVRKDGSTFWGSIVVTALHDDNGEVIGLSKVTRDLTEKKKAEDKMREYLAELENRNSELEQFAYIASHDLQEPMRKIQTFTEVIERNLDDEVIVKRYFEKINTSARRMVELITSVLNYSRLSKERDLREDADLNEVLAGIESDFELPIREKNAKIVYNGLPVLKAHPLQMHQLFSNLISNALKFSSGSPVITISSQKIAKEGMKSSPVVLTAGQYLEIVVKDNGIGFEQEYENLIFSMFQRLHPRQEYAGTGIGLAICKKIMENHKGFMRAEGEPRKGSSFYLYFPLY